MHNTTRPTVNDFRSRAIGTAHLAKRRGGEIIKSLGLGIRDGLKPRIALTSVLVWLVVIVFWAVIFVIYWQEIRNGSLMLTAWMAMGILSWIAPVAGPATISALGSPAALLATILFLPAAVISAVATFLLMGAIFLTVCVISVRVAMEWVLMGRIQKQCLTRYADLPPGVKNSRRQSLHEGVGALTTLVVGGAFCLLIPVIGTALLFLLICYLNARGLINDALEGVATDGERRRFLRTQRLNILLLGVVGALMIMPLAGLFAPSIFGATICHLSMRHVQQQRANDAEHTLAND